MIKKMLCVLVCFLLLFCTISVGTMVTAKESETSPIGEDPVYYIETYEQLKNHASKAQAGYRYILNDDIIQEDNVNDFEIVIPSGACFNLDLNGYSIKRITQGNDCALFRIRSDAAMVIYDSSEAHTGYCSFSEGYSDYYKAVFYNDGGELEINGGYYEIFSPYQQGDCSVVRTTSGYTYIYDGVFDSSFSWGGDTVSVGHNAYLYDVPQVVIFDGDFYGKYYSINVTPFDNYLKHGCLFPSVYVLGGNFYITNGGKNGEDASFAYCNNGWGKVIVAEGTVLSKCLNSSDQMFLDGVSKKLFSETIDDYTGGYYKVTAPPMIMSENLDYYYRLNNLCQKAEVNSYCESVYELHKEDFDEILSRIDTIIVSETEKNAPEVHLVNTPVDFEYINWYICDESDYDGVDTEWTHVGDVQNVTSWSIDERPEKAAIKIVRCVVTNSDLSTYEDIIRIVYEPLKEDEIVDFVEVTDVKAPVVGDTPDFDFTPADNSFYINGVYWTDITDKTPMKETDTFKSGHQYKLEVWIRANEYYKFKLDSDDSLDITALVDGKEAEVILPGTAISAELSIIYAVSNEPTEPSGATDATVPTGTISTGPNEPINPSTPADSTITTDSTDPSESSTSDVGDITKPSESSTGESTTSSEPVKDKGILGDVNGDGKVNVKDATLIQKAAAKLTSLTDDEILRGDVNADSKINVKDATAIQKYVAKIETGLPIGLPII